MLLKRVTSMTKDFKSGFVAIIGRPNVGKSTLLNQFLKQKIVKPKPQETKFKVFTLMMRHKLSLLILQEFIMLKMN